VDYIEILFRSNYEALVSHLPYAKDRVVYSVILGLLCFVLLSTLGESDVCSLFFPEHTLRVATNHSNAKY